MAFGFDSSLLLGQRPADPIGTARSMADLLQSQQAARIQGEQHRFTLASMLQKQQQEQRLADIYRQNAGTPDAVAPALMGAGFGEEAMGWNKGRTEIQAREAAAQKAYRENAAQGAEFLSRAFRDVNSQATLDAAHAALEENGWPAESRALLPRTYTPEQIPVIRHLASLGVSTKDVYDAREAEKRARIMAGAQQIARDQTAARGTVVPGLEIAAGAEPTAEDAKAVKKSMAAANRMKKYIADLEALYNENGAGTEFFGAKASKMKQLVTQIRLEGKTIAELGALSGPDMALMEAIAGSDPTSLTANAKALFGADYTTDNLNGLKEWVDNTLGGNMEAYGYQRAGGRAAPAPQHPSTAGGLTPAQQKRLEELRAKKARGELK